MFNQNQSKFLVGAAGLATLFLFIGCTPSVKLIAPQEPVKIDVDMKIEIVSKKDDQPPVVIETKSTQSTEEARRKRVSEYQNLLNRGVVGINRKGLLELRPLSPQDTDREYIEKVIAEENADRIKIMEAQGKKDGKTIDQSERELYERLRQMAFSGEWPIWIEVQNTQGQWDWTRTK